MRAIQLDILKKVSEYCEANHLTYYLGYGTLLGAVRHGGYIPWDDDIDIMMPRDDYEQFIQSFAKYNYYVNSHYKDSDYPYPFAKVSYEKTKLIENTDLNYEQGVNIDIFPLDTFTGKKTFNKIYKQIKFYQRILNIKKISINTDREPYKNFILRIGKYLFRPVKYSKIIHKINDLAMSENNANPCSIMGCAVDFGGKKDIMEKSIFENKIYLTFERHKYSAPEKHDAYLRNIYGDYMKLPPIKDRETHHDYKAFSIKS